MGGLVPPTKVMPQGSSGANTWTSNQSTDVVDDDIMGAGASQAGAMLNVPTERRGSIKRGKTSKVLSAAVQKFGDKNDVNGNSIELGDIVKMQDKFKMPPFMIHPQSRGRKAWDIIQLVLLLYIAMVVPFRVGFGVPAEGGWFVFETIVDFTFIADIFINFATAIDPEGDGFCITNRWLVARNYFRSWFVFDVLSSLPVDLAMRLDQGSFVCSFTTCGDLYVEESSTSPTGQLFRLFRLFRLIRMVKLLKIFRLKSILSRFEDELFLFKHLVSFAKLFIMLFFVGHLCSCFFYYFSTDDFRTEEEREAMSIGALPSWLLAEFGELNPPVNSNTTSVQLFQRYVASLYWAFTTLTTVGYGDISATTLGERVFAIASMLVGGFIFSFAIASMNAVVMEQMRLKKGQEAKMDSVRSFIQDRNLPRNVRREILDFYRQQSRVAETAETRAILTEIPFRLRSTVLQLSYARIVNNLTSLCDGDAYFMMELCTHLRPSTALQSTYIYEMGEVCNDIFIVDKGTVLLFGGESARTLLELTSGEDNDGIGGRSSRPPSPSLTIPRTVELIGRWKKVTSDRRGSTVADQPIPSPEKSVSPDSGFTGVAPGTGTGGPAGSTPKLLDVTKQVLKRKTTKIHDTPEPKVLSAHYELGNGCLFGENGIMNQKRRFDTAVSVDLTDMVVLQSADLHGLLSIYPKVQKALEGQVKEKLRSYLGPGKREKLTGEILGLPKKATSSRRETAPGMPDILVESASVEENDRRGSDMEMSAITPTGNGHDKGEEVPLTGRRVRRLSMTGILPPEPPEVTEPLPPSRGGDRGGSGGNAGSGSNYTDIESTFIHNRMNSLSERLDDIQHQMRVLNEGVQTLLQQRR
eukprot:CAMPEP_0113886518 /NCGR_PEP_ID=MMETSP0780_2-20120614/11601_1 /TAXON_ID=652834 /ORGANISM="Palpitomonas bilix" /LENGTH=863 /DNA_ID=CAMNT_0000874745 /DNA_START=463 /DNA_END=3054 /DNA_ORIENTATION=- /assembly_acc=CAM_ASM_000599